MLQALRWNKPAQHDYPVVQNLGERARFIVVGKPGRVKPKQRKQASSLCSAKDLMSDRTPVFTEGFFLCGLPVVLGGAIYANEL